MKKLYSLFMGIGLVGISFSQQVNTSQISADAMKYPAKAEWNPTKTLADVPQYTGKVRQSTKGISNRAADHSSFIEIGSTYYDLQSNGAMPHRIIRHKSGAVSATWTTASSGAAGFPGRGAGYNFKAAGEGSTWGEASANKVEASNRSGWPNIGELSNGGTFVIAHDATNGGFFMTKSSKEGDRPSTTSYVLNETPYKPIWARTANTGDTIHLICSYTDSAAPGEARAPRRKGIYAPMVYSRSFDGGETWNIQHQMLPNYDSTLTNNGGADQYAIDSRGNVVVIANADNLQGVALWKSVDYGQTWRRYLADSFPYAPYNAKKLMIDTPFTNDGTVDVIIDANGKVHAFWGLGRVFDDDTANETYSFYPAYQAIVYWNEDMAAGKIISTSTPFDRDEDGGVILSQATTQALSSGSLPSGYSTVARLGNTNAMRQPNAALDPNGNLYCIFSFPVEGDISDLDANYRDIGIVYSTDGGMTWGNPQNLTQYLMKEDDFGSVAREADNFLHFMWQQDEIPGTNLQNNDVLMANHEVIENKIMYQAVPVSEILSESIGMVHGLSTELPHTGEVFVVNQNQPNPFDQTSDVIIFLTKPGDVKIEVRNTMGALVKSFDYNNLLRGNHQLTINAEGLTSGIYTYTVISGANSVSKTMMVK
ncbi:MAG: T9SS type A sorting domain-containing protein [Bacteroidia bacterium]|nr:T9SS type A sorting domain-containing protein [Bacteroidia bacterium]